MRRKVILASLAALGLLAAGIAWHSTGLTAAQKDAPVKQADNPLPIRQVVLFNSGVGYFQREGEVDGNARVDLAFPVSDINDLLKSLVLQDLGGGKISTVSYDSQDPIEKILRSFALDLNNNPTFGQILNQARGEKVEILRKEEKGPGTKITGTIVGLEVQKKQVKDTFLDIDYLNLATDAGLQSFALDQVATVRFLNPVIEQEIQRALKVLAASHDAQKKVVSLGFNGAGSRSVRVGYVVARPIWKTTYRLRLDDNGKIAMQGWAIIENTSDDDWNNVRMTLVSGRPISFQMNLYEPLYIPRPTVEPDLFASLRPPVYSGAMDGDMLGRKGPAAPPPLGANMQPGQGFGGGGFGWQPGMAMPPGKGQNLYQNANQDQIAQQQQQLPMNKLTYEELQRRRQDMDKAKGDAKKAGAAIASLNFREGISSVATSGEIGDYYQYVIDQKISLARQKSAMLPILDQSIDGSKVSIYNASIHSKYPLLGLRLKNTSGQPLTQGPITVYEGSTYAGDTRVLDLQPNEERLLSYALDQTTEIKTDVKATPSPDMNFKIGEANMSARYKLRQTMTYTAKNRSNVTRQLVIEHPIRSDWELVDPKKPNEKTRDIYRFQVAVPAGKTITFDVVEEQARLDNFVMNSGQPQYVAATGIQVKDLIYRGEAKLVGLKIFKGILIPSLKERESRTYFVQNNSDLEREFTVDHLIRSAWVRLADGQEVQKGPDVFRFKLTVDKNKVGKQEVIEERVFQDKGRMLSEVPEAKLREYLASNVPSDEVKQALTKVLSMTLKIAETRKKLERQEKELKQVETDQARLRKNLEIIPQSAAPYKTFLDKFVAQETQIEDLQKDIRLIQTALQAQQRDLETFIADLKVD